MRLKQSIKENTEHCHTFRSNKFSTRKLISFKLMLYKLSSFPQSCSCSFDLYTKLLRKIARHDKQLNCISLFLQIRLFIYLFQKLFWSCNKPNAFWNSMKFPLQQIIVLLLIDTAWFIFILVQWQIIEVI